MFLPDVCLTSDICLTTKGRVQGLSVSRLHRE